MGSSRRPRRGAMDARLDRLIHAAPVFLFLHGSPTEPRSEDAAELIKLFREAGVGFSCYNFDDSEELEAALRARAGVASGSVLYVSGAVLPVQDALDLGLAVRERVPEEARGMTEKEAVREHCHELIASAPVVAFIKGTVEQPKCGFKQNADLADEPRNQVCHGQYSGRASGPSRDEGNFGLEDVPATVRQRQIRRRSRCGQGSRRRGPTGSSHSSRGAGA